MITIPPSGNTLAPYESDGLLLPAEAAQYLRLSPRTLEKLRTKGGGPRFARLGRRVLYFRQGEGGLDAWVEAHTVSSTAEVARG